MSNGRPSSARRRLGGVVRTYSYGFRLGILLFFLFFRKKIKKKKTLRGTGERARDIILLIISLFGNLHLLLSTAVFFLFFHFCRSDSHAFPYSERRLLQSQRYTAVFTRTIAILFTDGDFDCFFFLLTLYLPFCKRFSPPTNRTHVSGGGG